MMRSNEKSRLALAGSALAMLALLVWAGAFHVGVGNARPSTPDCLVSSEPSGNGPDAPTSLTARNPGFPETLGQVDLQWIDNSDNGNCFVIERRFFGIGQEYEVVVILASDITSFRDEWAYEQGDGLIYRVYAASEFSRSAYSNEGHVTIPIVEPTPTLPPALFGDLDCNLVIDARDVIPLIGGLAELGHAVPLRCPPRAVAKDLNCDGLVDSRDALRILHQATGLSFAVQGDCPDLGDNV